MVGGRQQPATPWTTWHGPANTAAPPTNNILTRGTEEPRHVTWRATAPTVITS